MCLIDKKLKVTKVECLKLSRFRVTVNNLTVLEKAPLPPPPPQVIGISFKFQFALAIEYICTSNYMVCRAITG